jgi:hypothetical protein
MFEIKTDEAADTRLRTGTRVLLAVPAAAIFSWCRVRPVLPAVSMLRGTGTVESSVTACERVRPDGLGFLRFIAQLDNIKSSTAAS